MSDASKAPLLAAVWASLLVGVGCLCLEFLLLAGLYLSGPQFKIFIEQHRYQFLLSIPLVFFGGFGLSLASIMEFDLWLGKWK